MLPLIKERQGGTLDDVYAVVYRDAIHFHVSSEGGIVKKAVYIALGIDMGGRRSSGHVCGRKRER